MLHKIQIDNLERKATAAEAAHIDAIHAQTETQKQTAADAAAARASATAKLAGLGLTNDEIAALVG